MIDRVDRSARPRARGRAVVACVGAGLLLVACGQGEPNPSIFDAVEGTTSIPIGGDQDAPGQDDDDNAQSSGLRVGGDDATTETDDPPSPDKNDAVPSTASTAPSPGTTSPGEGASTTSSTEVDPLDPDLGPDLDLEDDPADDPATSDRADVEIPSDALTDLATGDTTSLDQELGQSLTLLWFWSPGSSTSEREAAVAQRFAETFAGSVPVLAIGVGDDRAAADAFFSATDLSVPTLWATASVVGERYGVTVYPSAVLIDRSDTIVARWPGLSEETFRFVERIT